MHPRSGGFLFFRKGLGNVKFFFFVEKFAMVRFSRSLGHGGLGRGIKSGCGDDRSERATQWIMGAPL